LHKFLTATNPRSKQTEALVIPKKAVGKDFDKCLNSRETDVAYRQKNQS